MLVDSHCHLDRLNLDKYEGELSAALDAARERGVSAQLCICISDDNRKDVVAIAEQYPDIYASVGVHPCDVDDKVVSSETLTQWVNQSEKVIALGETGLDYFHSRQYVEQQRDSFIAHLRAGSALQLPVVVHTRDAREDTIATIKAHADTSSAGVLHCFTENWEMAKQGLDLGFYISFSGIVTFKNTLEIKEVAKKVPIDRILVETDSPYLAPVPFRGKPNEPKNVRDVAEYVAQLRGMHFEDFAAQSTENFYRLFSRAVP